MDAKLICALHQKSKSCSEPVRGRFWVERLNIYDLFGLVRSSVSFACNSTWWYDYNYVQRRVFRGCHVVKSKFMRISRQFWNLVTNITFDSRPWLLPWKSVKHRYCWIGRLEILWRTLTNTVRYHFEKNIEGSCLEMILGEKVPNHIRQFSFETT